MIVWLYLLCLVSDISAISIVHSGSRSSSIFVSGCFIQERHRSKITESKHVNIVWLFVYFANLLSQGIVSIYPPPTAWMSFALYLHQNWMPSFLSFPGGSGNSRLSLALYGCWWSGTPSPVSVSFHDASGWQSWDQDPPRATLVQESRTTWWGAPQRLQRQTAWVIAVWRYSR
jgi:hypothetical protein